MARGVATRVYYDGYKRFFLQKITSTTFFFCNDYTYNLKYNNLVKIIILHQIQYKLIIIKNKIKTYN